MIHPTIMQHSVNFGAFSQNDYNDIHPVQVIALNIVSSNISNKVSTMCFFWSTIIMLYVVKIWII